MTSVRGLTCALYPSEDDDAEKAAASEALVKGGDVRVVFLKYEIVDTDKVLAMVSNLG